MNKAKNANIMQTENKRNRNEAFASVATTDRTESGAPEEDDVVGDMGFCCCCC
jgi:hypothetical protein